MTADTNSPPHSKFEGSRGEWITGGQEKNNNMKSCSHQTSPAFSWLESPPRMHGKKHHATKAPAVFDAVMTEKKQQTEGRQVQQGAKADVSGVSLHRLWKQL